MSLPAYLVCKNKSGAYYKLIIKEYIDSITNKFIHKVVAKSIEL